jgi:hypothetical protein
VTWQTCFNILLQGPSFRRPSLLRQRTHTCACMQSSRPFRQLFSHRVSYRESNLIHNGLCIRAGLEVSSPHYCPFDFSSEHSVTFVRAILGSEELLPNIPHSEYVSDRQLLIVSSLLPSQTGSQEPFSNRRHSQSQNHLRQANESLR